jgi:hypothetical protein
MIALAFAFGGCALACDDAADGPRDSVEHCIAHCVCHNMSLVSQHPAVVPGSLIAQSHRVFDEQVNLPLFVADIFNPPRV